MNAPIRILGIGSPFGDDRIGWLAAEMLQGMFDPLKVSVTVHDRPGAKLVALMRGAEKVILLDAVRSGAAPGFLHRLESEAVQSAVAGHTSTHGFGLAEALKLAAKLGDIPPFVVLWGIEADAGAAAETSAALRALPDLVNAVAGEVRAELAAMD